jgi:hypothetical protein
MMLITCQTDCEISRTALGEASEDGNAASFKASTAMAQVFNTPELLDLILSHLPGSGLFAMTKVNRHHRAGVYTSISARRTLFLIPRPALPGTWSLVRHRVRQPAWAHRNVIELSAEVREPHWGFEPITPAEVCPLLSRSSPASGIHLDNDRHPQDSYLGRGESARFAFQPDNAVLLPGMMLTNPPCHDVCIDLVYVHITQSSITLSAERIIHNSHKHACGLTLSAVLEEAYGLLGDVVFHEQRIDSSEERRENTNLRREIAVEREKTIGHFRTCFKRTRLRFRGMTVVSAKEWAELERKAIRAGEV